MFPALIPFVHELAVEQHAQAAYARLAPLLVAHLVAVRAIPLDIKDLAALDTAALEKLAAVQGGVVVANLDQPARPFEQLALGLAAPPVDPAQLVILAVAVVVAVLGAAIF